jgi:hypothetical protein
LKPIGKNLDHTCRYKQKIFPGVEILEYLFKNKCSSSVSGVFVLPWKQG